MGAKRLAWSKVVAIGPHARSIEVGDRVLFDPEDKSEVEVHGDTYVVMRERDVHAVAAGRLEDGSGSTGLYL
jgi:chaperonin GroES